MSHTPGTNLGDDFLQNKAGVIAPKGGVIVIAHNENGGFRKISAIYIYQVYIFFP